MKRSQLIVSAALVLAASILIVEASRKYNGNQYKPGNRQHGAVAHYGGGALSALHNTNRRPQSYHSYAARPAMYGGYQMYNYQGYARNYPRPLRYKAAGAPQRQQRRQRGQRARQQRRYPANNNNNSNKYNQARNRYEQPASHPETLPAGYTLKPIKALALVPIAHGSQYYNPLVQAEGTAYVGGHSQKQRQQYRPTAAGGY